jgi:hypothetical protein
MRTSNILKAGRSTRELTKGELDGVAGGKITQVQVTENPGGNEPPGQQGNPHGEAMTTTSFSENPAGHRPPGQN